MSVRFKGDNITQISYGGKSIYAVVQGANILYADQFVPSNLNITLSVAHNGLFLLFMTYWDNQIGRNSLFRYCNYQQGLCFLQANNLKNAFKGNGFIVSGIITGNISSLSYAFRGCSALIDLDLSGITPSDNMDMSEMCRDASKLQSVDLSFLSVKNFGNTSTLGQFLNSGKLSMMFSGCSALSELKLPGVAALWFAANHIKVGIEDELWKNINLINSGEA